MNRPGEFETGEPTEHTFTVHRVTEQTVTVQIIGDSVKVTRGAEVPSDFDPFGDDGSVWDDDAYEWRTWSSLASRLTDLGVADDDAGDVANEVMFG
jgi:hypothetical protein